MTPTKLVNKAITGKMLQRIVGGMWVGAGPSGKPRSDFNEMKNDSRSERKLLSLWRIDSHLWLNYISVRQL